MPVRLGPRSLQRQGVLRGWTWSRGVAAVTAVVSTSATATTAGIPMRNRAMAED
jgi:hypothetical protein